MKTIYMCFKAIDDIKIDNLIFVQKKADAEKLVQSGEAIYYEAIETLNSTEVQNYYMTKIAKG